MLPWLAVAGAAVTGSGVGALIRWGVAPLVLLPKDCLPELLELAPGVSLLLTVVEILETAARRPDLCLPADLTALPDVCCGSEAVASAVSACSLALTEGGVDTEASSNNGRCPAAGNGVIAGACTREVKESSAAGCKAGAAGATEAALKRLLAFLSLEAEERAEEEGLDAKALRRRNGEGCSTAGGVSGLPPFSLSSCRGCSFS